MIPIVIPLHHGGGKLGDDTEIRFALRSIAQNYDPAAEVVIVGRKLPNWVTGVRHIAQTEKGLKTALHLAASAYPEGFFWFYDDCCLLLPTSEEQLKVTPCCREWSKPETAWSIKLEGIRQKLVASGKKAWDYSRPHGPYFFDKAMVDEGFADWPGMDGKLPWETWILSKRNWPRAHDVTKQYYGDFRTPPSGAHRYLNYCDRGLTEELQAWLSNKFPDACRFERVGPLGAAGERVRGIVVALRSRPRWEEACVREMAEVGIDLEVFDGFDGHVEPTPPMFVNRRAFQRSFGREPVPGEVGCFASHLNFARRAESLPPLSESLPQWRLVLEDDAVAVDIRSEHLSGIAMLAEEQGFDVVLLHTGRKNKRGHGPTSISPTDGKDVFTHAYLANLKACAEMSGWEMRHPIDHAITRSKKLRVGVLWGTARFNQRPPSESDQSIHRERKAAYAGRSVVFGSAGEAVVAPLVHQVWIGPAAMPARLAAYCEGVRKAFPSWTHRIWTEADMPTLAERATLPDVVLGNGHWGRAGLHTGTRSDVVRLEILRQFGGVYFDTDYEVLRSDLRPLFKGVEGFAYSDQRDGLPGIGMLAATAPGNAFIELYLRRAAAHLAAIKTAGDVLNMTGPERLRECLNYWMVNWSNSHIVLEEGHRMRADYRQAGVSAFFAEILHPYWYGTGTWATFDPSNFPRAWAAHHWEAGWKK
jgi:mannosyltransferase OCH1-like enzyme